MDKITRFAVSIEQDLLTRFDEHIAKKGYPTRSEAIRELISEMLTNDAITKDETNIIGTIALLYNHHRSGVRESLTAVQHDNHSVISSAVHVHLDQDKCLEVLIIHGPRSDVDRLEEELTAVKGVIHGGPILLTDLDDGEE